MSVALARAKRIVLERRIKSTDLECESEEQHQDEARVDWFIVIGLNLLLQRHVHACSVHTQAQMTRV